MSDEKQIMGDSKERVAYDLMLLIAKIEKGFNAENVREKALMLYHECLITVDGKKPDRK